MHKETKKNMEIEYKMFLIFLFTSIFRRKCRVIPAIGAYPFYHDLALFHAVFAGQMIVIGRYILQTGDCMAHPAIKMGMGAFSRFSVQGIFDHRLIDHDTMYYPGTNKSLHGPVKRNAVI